MIKYTIEYSGGKKGYTGDRALRLYYADKSAFKALLWKLTLKQPELSLFKV